MQRWFFGSAAGAGLLITFLAPAAGWAQETDTQVWTNAAASFPVADDTKLVTHVNLRFGDEADGISEMQLGGDLEAEAKPGLELGAGYSYVARYAGGDLLTREHRLRQQVGGRLAALAGGDLAGRLRLEQRWRDDGDDTVLRLRPRITWTRPVGSGGLGLRLLHEGFLHLNSTDWGGKARYDRMRNQASLRRRFGETMTGEIGYLNQYSFSRSGPDEMVHALTAAITMSF